MESLNRDVKSNAFSTNDKVIVNDAGHLYANHQGIVDRISSAGSIIYIHVQLYNVQTIIAFREDQLSRYE
ncbi:MAG TPA: hypothetical protein VL854_02725 [Nitrososphaeraceae archaeon]|jgi:hypothetical protein|nr:hypothetical protein [Nitrososphaeraceae archaeon]